MPWRRATSDALMAGDPSQRRSEPSRWSVATSDPEDAVRLSFQPFHPVVRVGQRGVCNIGVLEAAKRALFGFNASPTWPFKSPTVCPPAAPRASEMRG